MSGDRYRVRYWRVGDPSKCSFAGRRRVHGPPCGPPVARVTVIDWRGESRTYTVCALHLRNVYDGTNVAARRRAKDIYRRGRDAYLSGDDQ